MTFAARVTVEKWEAHWSQLIRRRLGTLISSQVPFFKPWLSVVILRPIPVSGGGENQVPPVITELNLDGLRNMTVGQELHKRPTRSHPREI